MLATWTNVSTFVFPKERRKEMERHLRERVRKSEMSTKPLDKDDRHHHDLKMSQVFKRERERERERKAGV